LALVDNLLVFGQALRRCGLEGPAGRMADAIAALEAVGIRRRADVRAALGALFVHRRDDLARFNEIFDLFWRARREQYDGPPLLSLGERPRVAASPPPAVTLDFEPADAGASIPAKLAVGAYSPVEVSRTKDFADFTPDELARAEAILRELGWQLGVRRTRRWARARHGTIDLRPVVRRNVKHYGELLDLPRRQRIDKPRPIVVLADVSGSMERYSRVLLQFVYGLTQSVHRVESFVFATRLTHITRAASDCRHGPAVTSLIRSVQDWGGGTRIGEALRAFNMRWARRVMRNGPVVLLMSDGWDRGDPDALKRELARVRRMCRRLIWLNPLLGSANYEPLTRGMQAALPLVDDFMPAHNLESLEQLASHLRTIRAR
jgi:uncharacterized protein